MSKLIYVHGTNGSGKSTLARRLLAEAGGPTGISRILGHKKVQYTHTMDGIVLVGAYGSACGGVDGLSPYAGIHDVVETNARMGRFIFAEGLVTPGLQTCVDLAARVDEHLFIYLDTDVEHCVQHVLRRRARKGTQKPYDTANLLKKRQSAVSWVNRLQQAGLTTAVLSWDEAYLRAAQELGLLNDEVSHLL